MGLGNIYIKDNNNNSLPITNLKQLDSICIIKWILLTTVPYLIANTTMMIYLAFLQTKKDYFNDYLSKIDNTLSNNITKLVILFDRVLSILDKYSLLVIIIQNSCSAMTNQNINSIYFYPILCFY